MVLVRPSRPAEFRYGDRVRVTGQLSAPPEFATFNYADYLARQGVYSLIDRPQVKVLAHDQGNPILAAIYAFRDRAYVVIQQILPEPQASLLSGILLGIDAGLPAERARRFSRHRHVAHHRHQRVNIKPIQVSPLCSSALSHFARGLRGNFEKRSNTDAGPISTLTDSGQRKQHSSHCKCRAGDQRNA